MRRKILLALVAFVPALLVAYSLGASVMASPGHLAGDGSLLVCTAFLIAGVGGYVIWNSLTSLARAVAPTSGNRPVLRPAGPRAS